MSSVLGTAVASSARVPYGLDMSIGGGLFWWVFVGGASWAVAGCASSDASIPETTGSELDAGVDERSTQDPILDGGGGVKAPPNGAELCPPGACNYQTGTGCPAEAGPASCVPLPNSGGTAIAPGCEPAGSTAFGAACSSWTECQPGSVCAASACRKLCCGGDWTGCPSGEHCIRQFFIQESTTSTADTGAFLCFPVNQCDALDPASCASVEVGTTCQLADPTGATACIIEGTGLPGDPCPCKGGFTCVDNGCRRLCRAVLGGGAPFCPPQEGRCVHFDRDPSGVGECTPTN